MLVVDDEDAMRDMLTLMLRRADFVPLAVENAEAAVVALDDPAIDVVLCDVRMPGMGGFALLEWIVAHRPDVTTVVMSAFGTMELAISAIQRGAYDYISKPFKKDEVVLTLRKAQERQRLRRENAALRSRLNDRSERPLGGAIAISEAMQEVARLVAKVAAFDTTVLVTGESGVGKERVCRAIHDGSTRASGPFLAINCAAIPKALLESELFGHVKGAFTDAVRDKTGLFEAARGGTLFLDEVGEMPLDIQAKLLRTLQERTIRRVGSHEEVRMDTRIVAATSRDLAAMVEASEFREDLYYRLNVMPIEIPPLRQRRADVVPLIQHFVRRLNERLGTRLVGLTPEATKLLLSYAWPGNVRELENTMEHAAVMAERDLVDVADLPPRIQHPRASRSDVAVSLLGDDLSVKRAGKALERELILRALERTAGNRTHAAKLLELSHRALLYKLREHGLDQ